MDTVLNVAQLIALICVSVLCIYVIAVLTHFKTALSSIQRDLTELREMARPVLENLASITDKLRSIAVKIDDQVDLVKGSLQSVKQLADGVVTFERRVQETLEEPILRVATLIAGIVNSIATLIERFRR